MNVAETLEELRQVSDRHDDTNLSVSRWSAGMHIHHCCLVIIEISNQLKDSVIPSPPKKWSIVKTFVFFTGIIPRGRGSAPEKVLPDIHLLSQQLHESLDESERIIREVRNIDSQMWTNHPVFGILTRDESIEFIRIHNSHHLKIIREILAL
jgi:hypothetical protein